MATTTRPLWQRILLRWAILTVAIAIAVYLVSGVEVDGGFFGYVWVAAFLGLVNTLVRPIVKLLSLPITIMTLGLFSLVINGLMLLLVTQISDDLSIDPWWHAIIAALVISIVSAILNRIFPDTRRR